MNANEYQQNCHSTWNASHSTREQILHAALGLADEAGECAAYVKKTLFGYPVPPTESLKYEIGDVLYYCAILASLYDFDLEQIMAANSEKLARRYG